MASNTLSATPSTAAESADWANAAAGATARSRPVTTSVERMRSPGKGMDGPEPSALRDHGGAGFKLAADGPDLAHEQVEVLAPAAMVGDRDPDGEPAADHGIGGHRDPALVELHEELAVERIEAVPVRHLPDVAEADDVERHRGEQLEIRGLPHQALEVARLVDVLADQPGVPVDPVLLEGHPHLERAEPARELDAVFAEPELAARRAALRMGEVARREREGVPVRRAAAHQRAARLVRDVEPLVQV